MNKKMTRINPDGRTFRVPIESAQTFTFKQTGNSMAIFGDVADRLGEYESLPFTLEELKKLRT